MNTGCVKNLDFLVIFVSSMFMDGAKDAAVKSVALPPLNAVNKSSTSSNVVVSSNATDT